MLTRLNAVLARFAMFLAVAGLWTIVGLRVLAGVRPLRAERHADLGREPDAGADPLRRADRRRGRRPRCRAHRHGIAARPRSGEIRRRLEIVILVFVGMFGAMMMWYGWGLTSGVINYKIPTLGISEGWHYAPLLVVRAADHAVLDRAHHRAGPARGSGPGMALTILCAVVPVLPRHRRAGRFRDRACRRSRRSSTRACRSWSSSSG